MGCSPSGSCDKMVANINRTFNGYDEVVLGAVDLIGIGKEVFLC
jgi:hypothetical protein